MYNDPVTVFVRPEVRLWQYLFVLRWDCDSIRSSWGETVTVFVRPEVRLWQYFFILRWDCDSICSSWGETDSICLSWGETLCMADSKLTSELLTDYSQSSHADHTDQSVFTGRSHWLVSLHMPITLTRHTLYRPIIVLTNPDPQVTLRPTILTSHSPNRPIMIL